MKTVVLLIILWKQWYLFKVKKTHNLFEIEVLLSLFIYLKHYCWNKKIIILTKDFWTEVYIVSKSNMNFIMS